MTASDRLLETLRDLHGKLRATVNKRWKRDLPLPDLIVDRWERAKKLGFGAGASIYDSSYVFGDVTVGEQTWIGPFTVLDGSGGLKIGGWCSISTGVQIYTHDSIDWALTGGKAEYERAPVMIGDNCYIGPQAIIRKGVKIGHHVVVGAGSFVNRDVIPYAIVAGSPCKQIGKVVIDETGGAQLVYDAA